MTTVPVAISLDYPGIAPGTNYVFPSDIQTDSPAYPLAPGSTIESVDIPQGETTDEYQTAYPDYVGTVNRGFNHPSGIIPTGGHSLNPAPGSVDLIEPRDTGSLPAPGRVFNGSGPVSGGNSNWTNTVANLDPIVAASPGPVRGGQDYSVQLANVYFATIAQQYSQQAVEAALISAV